jgi:hypothetical protein
MKRRGLLAAAALILIANAIALLGVERNRASAAQAIDLTPRELTLGYQGEENSGIDLRLSTNQSNFDWFDAAKLRELGFPASVSSVKNPLDWPARPAYVAFEYDGPAWQDLLAGQRDLPGFIAANSERQSHLVPVDASLSSDTLLQKYGNAGKHLIVRATIQPWLFGTKDGKTVPRGRIAEILGSEIHVPLPDALILAKIAPPREGAYTVRLAFGSHFEPWVISVTALPK